MLTIKAQPKVSGKRNVPKRVVMPAAARDLNFAPRTPSFDGDRLP